jgi:hypothetical protein
VAGLPVDTTIYTLRHSRIAALLLGNMHVQFVANVTDTSVRMIEQHYGQHITAHEPAQMLIRQLLAMESEHASVAA